MNAQNARLDWREGRRRRAWELKELGWKQTAIATALGVTPGAVSQWLKCGREQGRAQGVEALRRHPALGPTAQLTTEQMAKIPGLLDRGPEAYGLRGQVWTCKRVAEVIQRTFGVTSHPAHISRLLHALRHSVQQPIQRATQRNEAAIQA
jgi:transposase